MLRHVVCWRLSASDSAVKLEQSAQITGALQGLVSVIPEITSLTVGSDVASTDGNWDLVLVADFEDEAALGVYVVHPEHRTVAGMIDSLTGARAVVDFVI